MSSRSLAVAVLLAGLSIGLGACRPGDPAAIPHGAWTGPDARLDVDASGGLLRVGCTTGRIAAPLALDEDGRFDLSGTLSVPIWSSPPLTGPGRFTGHVRGRVLTITFRAEGSPSPAGSVELRLNSEAPPPDPPGRCG